jgi:hypothetical protein
MFRFFTRRAVCFVLALWVVSQGFGLSAQQRDPGLTPPPRPTPVKPSTPNGTRDLPFSTGESLTFNISWANYGTAAKLEMQVVDQGAFFGQEGFQLRTRVETVAEVRSIMLEVDNNYTSYVHASTMLPHRLEYSIHQGARHASDTVIIDQQSRTARFADETTVNLQSEAYDLTSLVYALRMHAMAPGTKRKFTALFGKEIVELEAEARERERVQTAAGSYEAVRVEINPKGHGKYRARIWFSTDAQRLPVIISGRLPFGEVRAELSSAAVNLRPKQILVREKFAEGPKGSAELYAEVERARPFSVGERLTYDVSWANFVSVGKASFSVRQRGWIGEQRVVEFVGEASTSGFARSLVDVDDQIISLAEVKTLVPVRSETRLREGARIKQVTASYNRADGSVQLTNGTRFRIAAGTLDLISLFYSIRASELKLGASYGYVLLDANHRPAGLVVKVMKPEQIGGPLGTLAAIQLDVMDREQKQVLAQVWISNDPRRLPLYFVVRTRFGELRFQLTTAVGTR